jgi:P4 family phage/plasmid primase-like protien
VAEEIIKDMFARDLKAYADSQGEPQIIRQRTNALLGAFTDMLKGHVSKQGVFKRNQGVIHVGNGMLHLDVWPPELRECHPEYYSRNRCPIDLVEDATCPQFENDLLASALDADDVSLIKRWVGSLILGGNAAHRIMLLVGKAGEGKSTLTEVVESVVGPENVTELRTELLGERFEIGRFLGKLLLTGKDVPAEFLMRRSATHIKKLVGHDRLTGELKHSNGGFNLIGDFGVVITCNSRLKVLLEGDADAWRRRLLLIEYKRPKPKVRIANFAQKLLKEEGSGILNWVIGGAIGHSRELADRGDFVLSEAQFARVEGLLAESDSVREFVRTCLRAAAKMEVLTVDELLSGYEAFCSDMGYQPMARNAAAARLPDLITEIHHVHKSHDIDGTRRGFRGLEFWRNEQ